MNLRAVFSLFLFAGLFCVGPAHAADDPSAVKGQLKTIEQELEAKRKAAQSLENEAAQLKTQESQLRREMVAAAAKAQQFETDLTQVEETLATLKEEEAETLKKLNLNREQTVGVLGALERLARNPPQALIAQPLSTSDLVRSAILLRAAVPMIEKEANRLNADIQSLVETRTAVEVRRQELAALTDQLKTERKRLDHMLERKKALREKASEESKQASASLKKLTGKAKNLKDVFNKLEKKRLADEAKRRESERQKREAEQKKQEDQHKTGSAEIASLPVPEGGAPITKAKGHLWMPAVGPVVKAYGIPTGTGLTTKGITISTRQNAQVVATYDGRVVYSGPFRGYGQLLIIDHGEGYHTLISGMTRIDSLVGQWLLAGEPVGVMGAPQSGKPSLYLEIRKQGQPINPRPWLADRSKRAMR